MPEIRILSEQDIERILTAPMAIEAVERAYLQKHAGKAGIWPMVFHEFDPGHADLDIKSGDLGEEGIFGLKVVSWYGANPGKGLPALFGTSMIFDLKTGAPKAVLNASAITHLRTGAAGALGAKLLAQKDSKRLVMVGAGTLAPFEIAATLLAVPSLESVTVVNPKTPERAAERLDAITKKVDALLHEAGAARQADIAAHTDTRQAVSQGDIIITATPAYAPIISADWIKPGTHISCIGADMSGKQELDPAIFAKARVFADDIGQSVSVGECEKAYKEGIISALQGEIGAVIAGDCPGRLAEDDITVFDSTGIALQDLACAALVLRAAEEKNLGVMAAL